MQDNSVLDEKVVEQARQLMQEIESGNEDGAREMLDQLTCVRETDMFQHLGKLTRELHDAMRNVKLDSKFAAMAEQEIPDAKERLNYVISMTEDSANKTLNAVEDALPKSESLKTASEEIFNEWQKFKSRELTADQFRELSAKLDDFLPKVSRDSGDLNSSLTDILMAQDFQDLTGQIIRQVIDLVRDVEDGLVELIRISGASKLEDKEKKEQPSIEAHGPSVPGTVDEAADVVSGQDDVDDLLSSLGF